jgi:hypothetical protein
MVCVPICGLQPQDLGRPWWVGLQDWAVMWAGSANRRASLTLLVSTQTAAALLMQSTSTPPVARQTNEQVVSLINIWGEQSVPIGKKPDVTASHIRLLINYGNLQATYSAVNYANSFTLFFLWEHRELSRCSDGLRAGRRGFDSRQCKIFPFSTASIQPPIQRVPGAVFLGVKLQRREADHSHTSSAKVKKM